MTVSFEQSKIVVDLINTTYDMWKKGWDESNGGNISIILNEDNIDMLPSDKNSNFNEFNDIPENLIGKYILITASGSQFRTIKSRISTGIVEDIGVIRIKREGYDVVWGFENNHKPTSELYMHLLSHSTRLAQDNNHRVVVHNHANNATAFSHTVEPNDSAYTLPLWKILTESIVVFPDGVGVLPWELPGTLNIGLKTAEKLKRCRIVVWTFHGILATGKNFQDCFGLIETVDKAAELYMLTNNIRKFEGLTVDNIKEVCDTLGVNPREEIFL
ncbi:rhamnulose-1-phosphate aldolase [Dolosigranulum pigrum]|uniref:Rhamnulose-1-phosphate aldolase n=1 Tax=Dolosigranulum pigrum ATCC 51524 TaxID=883103 RepID=H3NDR9_9LACT|nr:rhamnulose-1-phosphate aldolase [Dolosigranulum pigrum]EHR33646.1 rhamnulose-1-phosphate aldolase [Dolosigranulum pigrum ATCC 51524]